MATMIGCATASVGLRPRVISAKSLKSMKGSVKALTPVTRSANMRVRLVQCQAKETTSGQKIEGLADKFCTEFECTSSPALEPTVRLLANNIETSVDGNRALKFYSDTCTYKDPMRSFTGRSKYETMKYIFQTIDSPKAILREVKLVSMDVLKIKYRLEGNTPAGKLDMDFEETYKLNVISARVLEHEISWSMGRTGAPAAAYYTASRAAYSQALALKDVGEDINKTIDEALTNATQEEMSGDPTDPLKFFQQQDNSYNDMFVFAAACTFLYAVVQVLLVTG